MAKRGKIKNKTTQNEDKRPFRPRRYDKFILIVCEDQNTEPYYFRKIKAQFPANTVYLREIGTGKKPKGIVETAILEREKLHAEIGKSVDEVWIVFDKDDEGNNDTTLDSFNEAWKLAEKEKMCIAFNNEVFELWLLLHLIDITHDVAIPRKEIYKLLEQQIKQHHQFEHFIYKHGKSNIIDSILAIGSEVHAIRRAAQLLDGHKGKKPIEANPSTTVHILVKRLRELIDWYSYDLK